MPRWKTAWAALGVACGAAIAAAAPETSGYLASGALDATRLLPPAPQKGSYRYDADRRVFRETRALAGSARWQLAVADADLSVPAVLRDFSCAAGVTLTPDRAPRTAALMARLYRDSRAAAAGPKQIYRRQRPFLIDAGPVCESTEKLRASFDYPSGHTTWGWSAALVLAEAAPRQASAILTRGRAYGESRVVCGAHNASAIEAGRTTAAALVAALHGVPEFRDDVAAARSEIAALRRNEPVPDAPQCDAEAALIRASPY